MTTIRLFHAALACSLALVNLGAMAQTPGGGERGQKMAAELQKRFAAADANGDGRLTQDEAKAGMPMVYKHFDEIDSAHSGSITLKDIAAFARAQRGSRQTTP